MMRSVWSTLIVVVAVARGKSDAVAAINKSSGNLIGNLLDDNAGLLTNLLGGGDLLDDKAGLLTNLLGGGDLLGSLITDKGSFLGDLLGDKGSLPGDLLGGKGDLLGGLLGDAGEFLGGLLNSKGGLLGEKLNSVGGLVGGLLMSVARLAQNLANVLTEVDLHDPKALNAAFSPLAINQVCPACHLLNDTVATTGCRDYCTGICKWQF